MSLNTITLDDAILFDDTGGGEMRVGRFVAQHKDIPWIVVVADTSDQARADVDQFCEEMDTPDREFEILEIVP